MTDTTKIPNAHDTPKLPADDGVNDAGRTVMVGVLGGIISAAGYLVYTRLPDEQKEKLQRQVRGLLDSRIAEIRQNFNL